MKKKIALVTGGFTGESVVSLKSAAVVEKNLDTDKYEVYKIVLSRKNWYYEDGQGNQFPVDANDFSITLGGEKIRFDGVFNILHGSPGEDGKLAGYLDMLEIPYTTCDALTSAITMNKEYTKSIVAGIAGLMTSKSVHLFRSVPENLDLV